MLTSLLALAALAACHGGPPSAGTTGLDEGRASRKAAPPAAGTAGAGGVAIVPSGGGPGEPPGRSPGVQATPLGGGMPGPVGLATPGPGGSPLGIGGTGTPGPLASVGPIALPLDRPAAAPLVSDQGLGLFPAGRILANNGAGILSNNGGNLSGEVRMPTSAAGYRLRALADRAAPGLQVRLLSERGVPYGPAAITDAAGSFTLTGLPQTLPYVVVEATDGARRVRALAQAPGDGTTRVTLDAASTGATALALEALTAEGASVPAISAAGYVGAVGTLRANLDPAGAEAMLTAAPAAAADLARATFNAAAPAFTAGAAQLGAFVTRAGLPANRQFVRAVAAGPWLYVCGGASPTTQRAAIAADGSLGAFEAFAPANLGAGLTQHALARTGQAVYLVGGVRGGTYQATVARAAIAADGSLGAFGDEASSLIRPRGLAASLVIGGRLYVFGGGDAVGIVGDVEWAPIQPDGSLGAFTAAGPLAVPRVSHSAHRVGDFVYLVGGWSMSPGAQAEGRVERAPVQPDGSLGPFEVVPGVTLAQARYDHVAAVIGDGLYVAGGASGDPLSGTAPGLATIERAAIAADGGVGPFVAVPETLTQARKGATSAVVGASFYVVGGGSAQLDAGAITPR